MQHTDIGEQQKSEIRCAVIIKKQKQITGYNWASQLGEFTGNFKVSVRNYEFQAELLKY